MSAYQQESSQQASRWHYAEFDDSNFQVRGRILFFIVVLLSVILMVTLLFLYARWICRISPPPPPPRGASNHAPLGLASATIESLPIVLYNKTASSDFSESECCICLGCFGERDEVKVLPDCRHCFHSECVDRWLTVHSSCPLCRGSIRVDSPV